MKIDWELTARTLFNQLSEPEREQVVTSIQRLRDDGQPWTESGDLGVLRGVPGDNRKLYVLKAGAGLRVILARREDTIVVVDVFPLSQIEGLRSAQRTH